MRGPEVFRGEGLRGKKVFVNVKKRKREK